MADPTHLSILNEGVLFWNAWRKDNPEIRPDLRDVELYQARLKRVDFYKTNLRGARLPGATLREADLRDAILERANLTGATLDFADLSGADIRAAILRGANLTRASLNGAQLIGADLSDACLNCAELQGANLRGAELGGADFERARVWVTTFGGNNLSEVKGLETVKHGGPSFISIDTIYKSTGKIPEVFLRGCGVPENFITYMHSLVGQPMQFYSCFISYTEKDDAFSERLYNDLQAAGVRCWRWREDAKWGKSIWGSVDEAVRLHDKLVVVCSKHSLKAPAVLEEMERALAKEDEHVRDGKPGEVLFPITLDDFIFKKWEHERRGGVLKKHVGDFRKWKAPASYQTAVKRLIRDLEAAREE